MEHKNYKCPKCENKTFDKDEMSATGGTFTRLFDIQNRRFISLSCQRCGYTEFFKKPKGKAWENILDFFTG
jgi:predicted nucleic-acid-binding Zn-ribbon protein